MGLVVGRGCRGLQHQHGHLLVCRVVVQVGKRLGIKKSTCVVNVILFGIILFGALLVVVERRVSVHGERWKSRFGQHASRLIVLLYYVL